MLHRSLFCLITNNSTGNTQISVTSACDKALTVPRGVSRCLGCVKNMSVHATLRRAGRAMIILMGPDEEESPDVMTALRAQIEQDNRRHR